MNTGHPRLSVRMRAGKRPAIIFIHGFAQGAFVWEPLLGLTDWDRATLCIDLRGHGDSDWDPGGRYGSEEYATDVVAALASLGVEDVVLVGHSLGAEVAVLAACRLAALLRGLILVDGAPRLQPQGLQHIRGQIAEQSWHYRSAHEYRAVLASRFPLMDPAYLEQICADSLRPASPSGFTLKCDPALKGHFLRLHEIQYWESLRAISAPILLVRGAASAVLSDNTAKNTAASLPNCTLVTIPVAGHVVMLDNPAALSCAISSFLSGLKPIRGEGTR